MKYTKLLWVADITFGKEARAQGKPIREGPTLSPGHNTYTARAIYDSDTTSIITPCSATTHNPEHKDIAEIPDRWYISQIVAVSVMWSGLGGASHQQNIKGQNRYMSVRVTTVLGFYPNQNINFFFVGENQCHCSPIGSENLPSVRSRYLRGWGWLHFIAPTNPPTN